MGGEEGEGRGHDHLSVFGQSNCVVKTFSEMGEDGPECRCGG